MRAIALLTLLLAGPAFTVEKGKWFDVYGLDHPQLEACAKLAEAAAERFVQFFGSFPGGRAAILIDEVPPPAAVGDGAPDWKESGATWRFLWRSAPVGWGEEIHQLHHEIFCRYLGESLDDQPLAAPKYSSLPDWLDEAVAWLFASDEERAGKRLNARTAVARGDHIPFPRLFAMETPMAVLRDAVVTREPLEKLRNGQAPRQIPVSPELVRLVGEWRLFDAESLTVFEFLLERYGVEFGRLVVNLYRTGDGMEEALLWLRTHRKKGDPEPPNSIAELEAAWREWLAGPKPAAPGTDADWTAARGRWFDVFGRDRAQVAIYLGLADAAGDRFVALYGAFPGGRAAVELHEGAVYLAGAAGNAPWAGNGAKWVFPWEEVAPAGFEDHDIQAFPHELAHFMFMQHVDRNPGPITRPNDHYGSRLADWLDESCAVYHEDAALRGQRREMLGGYLLKEYIPLAELFAMDHPWAGMDFRPQALPATEDVGKVDLFYCECLSVLEFLAERYGAEFVREIVDQACRGKGVEAALPWLTAHRAKDAPAPPATIAELEKAWLAWAKGG